MNASATVPPGRPNAVSLAFVKGWEWCYRWYNDLVPVGPLLLVGRKRYRGSSRTFPDHTVVSPGDVIGSLHLDNSRLRIIVAAGSRHAVAWQVSQMLLASLEELARTSQSEREHQPEVFHGITWMRSHGLKMGFVTEQLAKGWRFSLLRWQFRLLRACYAPAIFKEVNAIQPREFWITRRQLQSKFSTTAGAGRGAGS